MSESSERDKTIGEAVDEHAEILQNTFHVSPETARIAAQDKVASGMRNPASADVDSERAAEARETEDVDTPPAV